MTRLFDYVLKLNPPYRGIAGDVSSILNVSGKVGPGQANKSIDVWIVQHLICDCGGYTEKLGLPQTNGVFDAITGFWIYHLQNKLRMTHGASHQAVDGIVSPAHGSQYSHGAAWTIVIINALARAKGRTTHQNLLDGTIVCPF